MVIEECVILRRVVLQYIGMKSYDAWNYFLIVLKKKFKK